MANEIKQDGFGNNAFQDISNSNINVTQIIGISPDFINLQTQLHDMEQLLALLPEEKEQERNELSARIYKHKELIEGFKSDVLKLAESFSRIEINTDRLRRAKAHFDKGEITEARVVLEDELEEMADEKRGLLAKKKAYEEDTVPKLQSKADEYLILAQTTALNYESPTRVADTKKYFEDSIECAVSFENLYAYGNFLWAHSEFRQSIVIWELALDLTQKNGDKQSEGNCLGNLGLAYRALGEFKKAKEFQEQSLKIARELDDRSGEGQSLGNLGVAYDSLGEFTKAIEFQEQSLKIACELGDRMSEGGCLGNLGAAYQALGEYQKAIEFQEQRLKIVSEAGDRAGIGQCLGNLGLAFHSLGEYQKAIGFHEDSLKILREIGNRIGEGQCLSNLGLVYHSLGEYQKAIGFHEDSLKISREIGNRLGEGQSLGSVGSAYYMLEEYQEAIEFQEKRLKIARETGDRLGEGNGLANLGAAYSALGEKEKACGYWRQTLAIFEGMGVPSAETVRKWMEGAGCE